uniref:tRNA (adenine(58)-N(1))-methyltransferase n=1 Tax=Eptatretus burgeri TaxID=7764 RepID=A0A8C4R0D6_EPTBU
MSLATWSPFVREGDTFMVYAGPDSLVAVRAKAGHCTQTKYGAIRHSDVLGRPFGSRFTCTKGGYVWILHPTPELWTRTLVHRTQILYAPDIAMVVTMLDVRPGSVVCEAGTCPPSASCARPCPRCEWERAFNCQHVNWSSVRVSGWSSLDSAIQPGPATLVDGIQCPLRDNILLHPSVSSKTSTSNIKDSGLEGAPQLFRIPQSTQTPPNLYPTCSQTPQLPTHP